MLELMTMVRWPQFQNYLRTTRFTNEEGPLLTVVSQSETRPKWYYSGIMLNAIANDS
jgi:hypothetical protein